MSQRFLKTVALFNVMTLRSWTSAVLFLLLAIRPAWAANEEEQLALESQLQQKIESILSKTLPPNSYIVTVKVEMENKPKTNQVRNGGGRRGGANPFLTSSQFMLPGVPQKKDFVPAPETTSAETVDNSFADEALMKRLSVTILVAPDISAEQIRGIREFISTSIPFNPLRGDDMVIQNSTLLKPITPVASEVPPTPDAGSLPAASNSEDERTERVGAPVLFLLGVLTVLFIIFIAFLFGPVRAFLNRLLTVLPRVGEQAAYAVSNSGPKSNPAPAAVAPTTPFATNPHTQNGTNADDATIPFRFIREDQLSKLPILFRQMAAPQVALVLAYLPPEWASRVLSGLSTDDQTAIMSELSQAQEVPPEIVQEIESQVKTKLPYLVGGVDWIQSVYQYTQPQTQRALLGTLNQQSPELAETLRRSTFFFEDIAAVNAGVLRVIVQEVGYPIVASALKEEKADFRDPILRRLPPAMREILQQELELSRNDRVASSDSKVRVVVTARRLLSEGRISLPERNL